MFYNTQHRRLLGRLFGLAALVLCGCASAPSSGYHPTQHEIEGAFAAYLARNGQQHLLPAGSSHTMVYGPLDGHDGNPLQAVIMGRVTPVDPSGSNICAEANAVAHNPGFCRREPLPVLGNTTLDGRRNSLMLSLRFVYDARTGEISFETPPVPAPTQPGTPAVVGAPHRLLP